MTKEKSLSDKLGFYFMVFQRTLNGNLIRCWLDGNDKSVFYRPSEIMGMVTSLGYNMELEAKFNDAFSETSMFLWDVDGGTVTRLKPSSEVNLSSTLELKRQAMDGVRGEKPSIQSDSFNIGWKTTIKDIFG